MSNAIPKWNEERTNALVAFVGDESPVSQETVGGAAESLETSTRSISSKLRKLGYEVSKVADVVKRAYTPAQESTLAAFVTDNSGEYTYAQIAEHFESGAFSAKSIQGKILSMELTDHVKPTEKVEKARTYTPDEESVFVKMANAGAFIEQIAAALNKTVNSVRGKALSLLRNEEIKGIPTLEFTKGSSRKDPLTELGDVSGMTVDEIAAAIEHSPRGVRVMLTRRGLVAKDYDGAARKEKASKEKEACAK